MAEWSKESDLRPDAVKRVGSNPTSCKKLALYECAGPKQHLFPTYSKKYLNYNKNN